MVKNDHQIKIFLTSDGRFSGTGNGMHPAPSTPPSAMYRMPPPTAGGINEPQECPYCRRNFSCYYSLKRHFQDKHEQSDTLYVCEFCNRRYRTKNSLTTHKSLQHRGSSGMLKRLLRNTTIKNVIGSMQQAQMQQQPQWKCRNRLTVSPSRTLCIVILIIIVKVLVFMRFFVAHRQPCAIGHRSSRTKTRCDASRCIREQRNARFLLTELVHVRKQRSSKSKNEFEGTKRVDRGRKKRLTSNTTNWTIVERIGFSLPVSPHALPSGSCAIGALLHVPYFVVL